MAVLFGFPGLAIADQASISNTGPDSYNKIAIENKEKCDVENNNNVGVMNINKQNAHTGNAVVGSNWGAYSPEAWQAKGYSYEQWHAAVSAHMAEYEGDWGGHGGGNTVGGNATSGNATNVNNTSTNVSIDNSGACAEIIMVDTNGDGKPDTKVHKQTGQILGSTSSSLASGMAGMSGAGGSGGHVLGASSGALGAGGQAGAAGGAFNPTTSGGAGGGAGGPSGGGGGAGSSQASISNTGPDSYNKIVESNKSYVNVENNNNVNVSNYSKQYASTGDATVSGNTTGGAASSGGAYNDNGTNTGAGINN
jgi:hypothetical protein